MYQPQLQPGVQLSPPSPPWEMQLWGHLGQMNHVEIPRRITPVPCTCDQAGAGGPYLGFGTQRLVGRVISMILGALLSTWILMAPTRRDGKDKGT